MVLIRTLFVILCVLHCAKPGRISLDMKKILIGKVFANGVSVPAKSLNECLRNCKQSTEICDGVIYHEHIFKCRLVAKCSPSRLVDNTSSTVYFSKRPRITVPGYVYDPKSDSCVGLFSSKLSYANADKTCEKQKATLLLINSKKLNILATSLLNNTGTKWAWLGKDKILHNTFILAHGVSGNDVLPRKIFSPEVVRYRNTPYRSCWGINNKGQWGQFSCKNDSLAQLCQINPF